MDYYKAITLVTINQDHEIEACQLSPRTFHLSCPIHPSYLPHK